MSKEQQLKDEEKPSNEDFEFLKYQEQAATRPI